MKKLTKAKTPHARLSIRGQFLLVAVCLATAWLGFWAYAVLADVSAPSVGTEADTLLGPSAPDEVTTLAVSPTVRIDPATLEVAADEIFSVTVEIDNVTNLGAFEFDLKYTADVVQPGTDPVTDCVRLGPFLGSTGRTVSKLGPTVSEGLIEYGAYSVPPPATGPSGSGTLVTITLQAGNSGTTPLDLQDVIIIDSGANVLDVIRQGGQVTVTSGGAVYLPIILK